MLDIFQIKPEFDLDIMEASQSLSTITSKCLLGLEEVFRQVRPDLVLVPRSGCMGFCPWDTRRTTAKHTSKMGRPSMRKGTTKEIKVYCLNIPFTDTVAMISPW